VIGGALFAGKRGILPSSTSAVSAVGAVGAVLGIGFIFHEIKWYSMYIIRMYHMKSPSTRHL
jgi:hypothetical protein